MPADVDASSSIMTAASNSTASDDATVSFSGQKRPREEEKHQEQEEEHEQKSTPTPPATAKKKRNLPGTPDPDAEVVALSPRTLMATNRFLCEVCGKGFQRDQNLQLHRRGHNLPWKLRRTGGDGPGQQARRKRVYVCPEESCVHHHPSRALGDLTGVKKHYCRKHGEKKWRCDRCAKKYAVMSDWKAHCKTCGLREYSCDCGTVFSRRDSFITHRAFCDVLAGEFAKPPPPTAADSATTEEVDPMAPAPLSFAAAAASPPMLASPLRSPSDDPTQPTQAVPEEKGLDAAENTASIPPPAVQPVEVVVRSSIDNLNHRQSNGSSSSSNETVTGAGGGMFSGIFSAQPIADQNITSQTFADLTPADPPFLGLSAAAGLNLLASPRLPQHSPSPHMSATALLQKAAQMGAAASNSSLLRGFGFAPSSSAPSSSLAPDPAGLGLGLLPYDSCAGVGFAELVMGGAGGQSSSLCGSRPSATLDFLGLGMAGAGAGAAGGGGFTALFTSIAGGGLGLGPAGQFANELPERKPPTGPLM